MLDVMQRFLAAHRASSHYICHRITSFRFYLNGDAVAIRYFMGRDNQWPAS